MVLPCQRATSWYSSVVLPLPSSSARLPSTGLTAGPPFCWFFFFLRLQQCTELDGTVVPKRLNQADWPRLEYLLLWWWPGTACLECPWENETVFPMCHFPTLVSMQPWQRGFVSMQHLQLTRPFHISAVEKEQAKQQTHLIAYYSSVSSLWSVWTVLGQRVPIICKLNCIRGNFSHALFPVNRIACFLEETKHTSICSQEQQVDL